MSFLIYAMILFPYFLVKRIWRLRGTKNKWRTLPEYLDWFSEKTGLSKPFVYYYVIGRTYRFEKEVSKVVENSKGKLFIDIGCNVGHYSIIASSRYNKVIAIDPYLPNLKVLEDISRYAEIKNIKSICGAVSDRDGESELYFHPDSDSRSILTSVVTYTELNKLGKDERQLVPTGQTTTVYSLASILGQETADMIKVDAEGAEWDILEGATPVMDKISSWIVECHNIERIDEMRQTFNSFGYKTELLDFHHVYAFR